MPKIFNNPKKTVYMIVGFIAIFVSYLYFTSDTDAAEMEIGPTFTDEFNGGFALTFSERFSDKYELGLSVISDQNWDNIQVGNNGNFWAAYVVTRPDNFWKILPSEFLLGANYWIKTESPITGCHVGYILGTKYRFNDFSVGWRHWSNAGSCKPNRGQDLLTFGWRF